MRTNNYLLLLSIFLISLLTTSISRAKPLINRTPHSIELSLTHYYFDYEEDLEHPKKSAEYNWLTGYKIIYIFREEYDKLIKARHRPPIYGRFIFDYTSAATVYDGSTQNLETGEVKALKDKTNNVIFNIEGDIGFTIKKDVPFGFSPYIGFSFHSWERNLGADSSTGYKEIYQIWTLPLGLRLDFTHNHLRLALDSSYRPVLAGAMQAYLSEIDSHFNDPIFKLGNIPGWKFEGPVSYRFLIITPWYEYSAIGKSNKVPWTYTQNGSEFKIGDVYEPASRTYQYGINAGLLLNF